MVDVRPLDLPGLVELRPRRFSDDRGFFSETWNQASWQDAGINVDFVQDNYSLSSERGVLRGLHYQAPPAAQDKLVRVSRGAVFDVAVDIRHGSPTFGRWTGLILSAAEWNQLFVPKGFAHGFVTIEPGSEVQYKVSAAYSPEYDRAIRFDDPIIAVEWPIEAGALLLSDKDSAAPLLADRNTGFTY
ncbi:MAG: dTDP-4-dehydrorhamnose 3,5-epimerase [Sphingomonas sp.]|uniref:dTDP-4-dehydrorhamnose 3,5-epimerase n=1 Tax=Sphingomonas sp. TaxID=28214 RepID=UPI001792C717|nr:dTDP-4-dehydrorhamnose 3,5-epimerase [Sphingomonas sp.]MBA3666263.1 dTDP-4-dehydrorhamnose 3,5-epimerase [Sphingomonas sp.]